MKIMPLDDDNGRKNLSIEVEWEKVAPDYQDLVAGYLKQPIAGFRSGKVPLKVVEKRFKKKIAEDLIRRCVQRFGQDALRQTGLETAGPLEAFDIDWVKGKPLRFKVCFLPLPNFEIPDLLSIRISDGSEDPLGEISRWLLEHVDMRLPDELIRAELAVEGTGMTESGSCEWTAAAQRVKLMLILKRIAGKEGVAIDEADVETRIREKASEFGTTVEILREHLVKGGGMERLHDMLIAESVLEYLRNIGCQHPN